MLSPAQSVSDVSSESSCHRGSIGSSGGNGGSGLVLLDVGGRRFRTSMATLKAENDSHLLHIVEYSHVLQGGLVDRGPQEEMAVFIDRDGEYFKFVLNWLRCVGMGQEDQFVVPDTEIGRKLLRCEAEYFQLDGLVNFIDQWEIRGPEVSSTDEEQSQDGPSVEWQTVLDAHNRGQVAAFPKINLSGELLLYLNFQNWNFVFANFENANLKYVNFEGAKLEHANFRGANLEGANFSEAVLVDCNFESANLCNCTFQDAICERAWFYDANCSGAQFKNARVEGAFFFDNTHAILKNAKGQPRKIHPR